MLQKINNPWHRFGTGLALLWHYFGTGLAHTVKFPPASIRREKAGDNRFTKNFCKKPPVFFTIWWRGVRGHTLPCLKKVEVIE